jgi:hypothetical protein
MGIRWEFGVSATAFQKPNTREFIRRFYFRVRLDLVKSKGFDHADRQHL